MIPCSRPQLRSVDPSAGRSFRSHSARFRSLVLLALGVLLASPGAAQTRRALLVGIGTYTRPAAGAPAPTRTLRPLDGPRNDVEAMRSLLVTRYGVSSGDIATLLDGAATRRALLGALDSLVRTAAAGDDVLFFYAGHGSQVRNDASREADKMDETLVPADALLGAPDVRDKELRMRFAALAGKGVRLTVIVDACHSGSIARGVVLGETRQADPAPTSISDADSGPAPETLPGVLILSAAQDVEFAQEVRPPGGAPVGAFSSALVSALAEGPPDQSVASAFVRARARIKGLGLLQEPVIGGDAARRNSPLFGDAKDGPITRLVLPVSRVDPGSVEIEGGRAVGLTVGSRLTCTRATPSADSVAATIAELVGVGRSRARVPASARLAPGDACRVVSVAPEATAPVRLWIGAAVPASQRSAIAAFDTLLKTIPRVRRVLDPVVQPPTHVVWWGGRSWQVRAGGGRPQELRLTADGVRRAFGAGADVYLIGSPAADVRAALVERLQTVPVSLARDLSDADYVLAVEGTRLSWVRASGDADALLPQRSDAVVVNRPADAAALAEHAGALARVWAWQRLPSPPNGADAFPYQLTAWENAHTGAQQGPDVPLSPNTAYRAVLTLPPDVAANAADRMAMGQLQARYVYLFAIDQNGNGDLLFPLAEYGQVENRLSPRAGALATLPAARDQFLFSTGEAGSRDVLVLLTTLEPLPDPSVLTFRGARTRSAAAGASTALSRFLFGVGEATRSDADAVPATWSLERIPLVVGQ